MKPFNYKIRAIVYEGDQDSYSLDQIPKDKIIRDYNFRIDNFPLATDDGIANVAIGYARQLRAEFKKKGLL